MYLEGEKTEGIYPALARHGGQDVGALNGVQVEACVAFRARLFSSRGDAEAVTQTHHLPLWRFLSSSLLLVSRSVGVKYVEELQPADS